MTPKVVSEIFNRAGEITKKAGILWGYHNHSNEFKRVLKAGEKPEQNPNPWAPPKRYLYRGVIPKKIPIRIRLCSSWMYIGPLWGQQDPVEWMENYPNRFKLLHIKDRWIIGDSGMMNFPNIFKKAYEDRYPRLLRGTGRRQERPYPVRGRREERRLLQAAPFVK